MPQPSFEFVRMIVGQGPTAEFGKLLDQWLSYEVNQSIFHPASFSFRLAITTRGGSNAPKTYREALARLRDSTKPDTVVRLEQGERRTLLFRGIIDTQNVEGDKAGEFIDLSGRDAGQVLQDNEARPELRVSGKTLPQLAEEILVRYRGKGIPFGVRASADANRDILTGRTKQLVSRKTIRTSKGSAAVKIGSGNTGGTPIGFVAQPVKEAKPHPGETEWQFLERHAKNLGVMMYMSAEGDLIFTAPDYSQPALFQLRRYLDAPQNATNNILSGGRVLDTANTASAVHIYGRSKGRGAERSQVTATVAVIDATGARVSTQQTQARAAKPSYGQAISQSVWPRERTIRDSHADSKDKALKLAQRELAMRNANYERFEYTMADHAQDGTVYAYDCLANVADEVAGYQGTTYLTGRSIRKARSEQSATTTTLQGVPKGAIVL